MRFPLAFLTLVALVTVASLRSKADATTASTTEIGSCAASSGVGGAAHPTIPVPTVRLHNGVDMPLLQLGTAHLITKAGIDSRVPANFTGILPERTYRQIQVSLEHGLRAFDTALIYRSHTALGTVLGTWWQSGTLNRSDVWITTKVFHPDARHASFGISHLPHLSRMTPTQIEESTREQFETSLVQLGVGYIDLLLLHWPSEKSDTHERSEDVTIHRQRRLAAWRVLEEVYRKGWARAIGVSNFAPRHLEQLQEDGATIVPMVNQFEASVTLQYPDLVQYCHEHEIVPQAYSPFGRGLNELPLELQTMAGRYTGVVPSSSRWSTPVPNVITPGQVAIQYLLQLGYGVVYLSNTAEHMVSNTKVLLYDNFTLTNDDMALLKTLHRPDGGWGLPSPHELD